MENQSVQEVLKNLSYGVYVVSTKNGEKSTGCVANSIMQVTFDTIAVSINQKNFTNECIKKSGKFALSILATDANDNIIPVFGFQTGRKIDKFENMEKINVCGLDVIAHSIGYLILELKNTTETETHTIFLGKIIDGGIIEKNKTPMTYAYYHQVKKGLTPENAPTFIKKEAPREGISYKCKICGYIYEGDIEKEPADYVCPVCKQPKSVFEKI